MKKIKKIISSLVLLPYLLVGCGGSVADKNILILGETFVFKGEKPVVLRQPLVSVKNIYSYDASGIRKNYIEGVDWVYSSGGIARTRFSRIPNFDEYKYSANEAGFFEFISAPRNPPLTLNYQIYIDYYSGAVDKLIMPANKKFRPSKIVCVGDSITLGAHTLGQYYGNNDGDSYCGLLRKYLGSSVVVENKSVAGSVATGVLAVLPELIAGNPDLVILGFGMNDHVGGSLEEFNNAIMIIVERLRKSGVEVILMGFFQQNKKWILEDQSLTLAFNSAMRDISNEYDVLFVDVYATMDRIFPGNDLIDNVMGDYMHHPNNYGHRIYFSLLLPYFIMSPIPSSALADYVYF